MHLGVNQSPPGPGCASSKKLQNLTRHAPATLRPHAHMYVTTAKIVSPTFNWLLGAALRSAGTSGSPERWKCVNVARFSFDVSLPFNLAPLKRSSSRLGLNIWRMFRICRALLTLGATRLMSGNTGHPAKDTYGLLSEGEINDDILMRWSEDDVDAGP